MANTFFELNNLTLTAFVGKSQSIQINVGQSFAQIDNQDAVKLAGALLERVSGKITATGCEQSTFNHELQKTESNDSELLDALCLAKYLLENPSPSNHEEALKKIVDAIKKATK